MKLFLAIFISFSIIAWPSLAVFASVASYSAEQWHLRRIKANDAWSLKKDSPKVVVAVIDSGVQIDHPDLKQVIWRNQRELINGIDDDNNGYIDDSHGWDFVGATPDPSPKLTTGANVDSLMHGTIVAGLISAYGHDLSGVSGVTWHSQIMPLRAMDSSGHGDSKQLVRAIDYAVKNGADIINLSFTGNVYSRSLEEAITRAYQAGVLVVAAAGNDSNQKIEHNLNRQPLYPVCFDGRPGQNMVFGVAAVDVMDQKTVFSAFGDCVDLVAPGVSMFSTLVYWPGKKLGNYSFNKTHGGYWSGTSMAVPLVSGAAALLMATNPYASRAEIINYLRIHADDVQALNPRYKDSLGAGRLNVFRSVFYASNDLKKITPQLAWVSSEATSSVSLLTLGSSVRSIHISSSTSMLNPVAADLNADGATEVILANAGNAEPWVRIYGTTGLLQKKFLAYDKSFRGGVNVAVGDVDGDGREEIVCAANKGGGPHIRIFDGQGNLKKQFFAYDKSFRGGVNVAVGDVDGDGREEVIAAIQSAGREVRVFNGHGRKVQSWLVGPASYRGGLSVVTASFDRSARKKPCSVILAGHKGGQAEVYLNGHFVKNISLFNQRFSGQMFLSVSDLNSDGYDEIMASVTNGGAPHVRAVSYEGDLIASFYAFDEEYRGGVKAFAL